jgi:cytidylate kinase
MPTLPLTDRVARTLTGLTQHWEARRRTGGQQPVGSTDISSASVIALSRQAGIDATSIAGEIGQRLGWSVYDHELVERIAQEMGLHTSLLQSLDETHVSWLTEMVDHLMSMPSQSEYVHRLLKTVLALGIHGECVIVGRGAAHVLPIGSTLRVRLIAPLNERVTSMCQQTGISRAHAQRQVEAIDRERTRFVEDHFQKDPNDCENYDLVLNTSQFSPTACAQLAIDALHLMKSRLSGGPSHPQAR